MTLASGIYAQQSVCASVYFQPCCTRTGQQDFAYLPTKEISAEQKLSCGSVRDAQVFKFASRLLFYLCLSCVCKALMSYVENLADVGLLIRHGCHARCSVGSLDSTWCTARMRIDVENIQACNVLIMFQAIVARVMPSQWVRLL
jgi:hypothetical protein